MKITNELNISYQDILKPWDNSDAHNCSVRPMEEYEDTPKHLWAYHDTRKFGEIYSFCDYFYDPSARKLKNFHKNRNINRNKNVWKESKELVYIINITSGSNNKIQIIRIK